MCVHIENPLFSELRGPEGAPYSVLRKGRRDGHVSIALSALKASVSNGIHISGRSDTEFGILSPDIPQLQARQDYIRVPDIQFDSRLMRHGVVDNQSQLVLSGREISWEIKVEEIVDRFVRLPLARQRMVHVHQVNIILVDPSALNIVETQGNHIINVQPGDCPQLQGHPQSAFLTKIEQFLR